MFIVEGKDKETGKTVRGYFENHLGDKLIKSEKPIPKDTGVLVHGKKFFVHAHEFWEVDEKTIKIEVAMALYTKLEIESAVIFAELHGHLRKRKDSEERKPIKES